MQSTMHATAQREWLGSVRRAALGLGTCLVLGGCGLSYIELEPQLVGPASGGLTPSISYQELPGLLAARTRAEEYRDTLDEKLGWNQGVHLALDVLTLGLAAGGGVAALYDAHRDTYLGLGLGAVGASTVNSLFFPKDRMDVLRSAMRALQCTIRKADDAAASLQDLRALTFASNSLVSGNGAYQQAYNDVSALVDGSTVWDEAGEDKDRLDRAGQALGAYEVATSNINILAAQDIGFGSLVNQTVDLVVSDANQRMADIQPSPEAVLKAATSIGTAAPKFADEVAPKEKSGGAKAARVVDDSLPLQRARLDAATSNLLAAVADITARVKGTTNTMAAVATTCVLDRPLAKPLELQSNKTATLEKGKLTVFEFTNVEGKLRFEWKGGGATPDIDVQDGGSKLFVVAGPKGVTGPVTLWVFDERQAPTKIEITLTVKQ